MEHAYPEGFLDAVVNIFHMVLEEAPVISLRDFSQVEPQLLIKVFTAILSINLVPVLVQPTLIILKPKSSMLEYLALPKVQWLLENFSAVSLQCTNDAKCFFRAGHIRIPSVCLTLLSISNLDVMSRFSNTPTVISHIALTIVGTSWSNVLIQVNLLFIRFFLFSNRLESLMTNILILLLLYYYHHIIFHRSL